MGCQMRVDKGFTSKTNSSVFDKTGPQDEARADAVNRLRRSIALHPGRLPMNVVMIRNTEGKTRDIVTGVPPSFNAEARAAWAKRREEASIEGLFK